MGLFSKFKEGLKKTKDTLISKVESIIHSFTKIDENFFEELEEILVTSDVGVKTAEDICGRLREKIKQTGATDTGVIKGMLKEVMVELLGADEGLNFTKKPLVVLVIGVNGAGKTTTIGKLAANLKADGKKVILGAADTFRAAAIDQLQVWATRAGVELIKQKEGSDPAAVVYDTITAGVARGCDVIICDTAGRLHNKKNLMDELSKINRIVEREVGENNAETLLVLDGTTGQNAISQAKLFKEVAKITGIVLTKLDGTAKGGSVIAVKNDTNIPVKYIGVGEKIDDLQEFNAKNFVDALFD